MKCKGELTADCIGLSKKFFGRETENFMCLHCMAEYFSCSEKFLKEKAEYFRRSGCMLFSSDKSDYKKL